MLFLGIILWKGASGFIGGGAVFEIGGEGGEASILSGGCTPWGTSVLMGRGVGGWAKTMPQRPTLSIMGNPEW